MATHSIIFTYKIPWTEPCGLQSMESQRTEHDWVINTHTHLYTNDDAKVLKNSVAKK